MGIILYIIIFVLVIWFVLHTTIISDKTPTIRQKVKEKLKISKKEEPTKEKKSTKK